MLLTELISVNKKFYQTKTFIEKRSPLVEPPHPARPPSPDETGLRGRKKARRRREILRCAARLFDRDGVDATTIATIADEAGISPPTVFNYFGSKENILSALVLEGTARERSQHMQRPRPTNCKFADVLGDLLCEVTENTMRIAGKRVWRYAEAINIRRPNSEFETQFAESDAALQKLLCDFLSDYDVRLRNGKDPDLRFLADLFFSHWTMLYFSFIKEDTMPLEVHKDNIRRDVRAMVSLLFDDGFARTSPLKPTRAPSRPETVE